MAHSASVHSRAPRVAVVLSGCGFLDGSEIHEAVSVLIHLSRLRAHTHCFAPDAEQAQTINHYTGEIEVRRQRNMLHESARISRGKQHISPLAELDAADFDAVIFPGGYGAAKNLCTFAVDGADCAVHPEVERTLRTFHAVEKPIGMCCIAPAIAARVLGTRHGGPGVRLTLGAESPAADAARTLGAEHVQQPVTGLCVDRTNRLATTPAYMYDATPHDVFQGIGAMVDEVLRLVAAHTHAPAAR